MRLEDPERLAALRRSGLMRKDTSQRLGHVCYTAAQLLHADLALLNVLDELEQRMAAEWPPMVWKWPVLNVDESGCKEVIETDETVVVPDTREHALLCQLPFSATYRGYLSSPVRFEGHAIGSLCAFTHSTRAWTLQDVLAMDTLAQMVGTSLELAVAEREGSGSSDEAVAAETSTERRP